MKKQKKQKRFYYIQYSPYGVRISPDSLNGNAFSLCIISSIKSGVNSRICEKNYIHVIPHPLQ